MKVTEALQKGEQSLSFEFFPPKTPVQEANLFAALDKLQDFKPNFCSVTYGALGNTAARTFQWVKAIKEKYQITPVAHLTCIAASQQNVADQLAEFSAIGVDNILALRGDVPAGTVNFVPPVDGFSQARDLVAFIKRQKPKFCVGVAGHPEGHCQSPSLKQETEYLKEKIDAGSEYIITQLFFDNRYYFDFVDRCRKAGIKVPIIPGVMPITSVQQIKKMTGVCGATIPADLQAKLDKYENDKEATVKIGIEQALKQCQELLEADIPGIHFFVLNQSEPISKILAQLGNW